MPPRTWDLRHSYFVRVPPTRLFAAMTEPKQLVRWLCDIAELEPRKGGRYRLGWTDGPVHEGRVVDFLRNRSLRLSWEWEGVPLRTTRFGMAVAPAKGGAIATFTHSGFPRETRWAELYAGAEWGWTYFAMNLKSFLESGRDLRSPRDG